MKEFGFHTVRRSADRHQLAVRQQHNRNTLQLRRLVIRAQKKLRLNVADDVT